MKTADHESKSSKPEKPQRRKIITAGITIPLIVTLRSHHAMAQTPNPCQSILMSVTAASRHVCGL